MVFHGFSYGFPIFPWVFLWSILYTLGQAEAGIDDSVLVGAGDQISRWENDSVGILYHKLF